MRRIKENSALMLLAIVLLLTIAASVWPTTVVAQMQPWLQQEQMRQAYERQQWLQWQRQEQIRQMSDRQQWLLWQQQERIRQLYQR
jgi:hypothetical protein